ncbi:CPm [Mint virus 1]|uniref:CPm n=1 Tax=Mint virus 1 TaxID=300740 RepID=Q5G7G2_9CLOS|nr:CPm [Mint virus 1]AAW32897.1 CPm [Mint virus 1]
MALTLSDADYIAQPAALRDASSEIVEKFSEGLDVNSITHSTDSAFSKKEAEEAIPGVLSRLRELTKADSKQDIVHFMMLMCRAQIISTSMKVKYTGSYSYTVGGMGFTIKDADIFPHIIHMLAKYKKPNPLRALFTTFETPFIHFSKIRPDLAETRSACRRGTPTGYGYLSADFLTGSSPSLNDRERAIVNRSSEHAINRANLTGASKELVSLYDIGA